MRIKRDTIPILIIIMLIINAILFYSAENMSFYRIILYSSVFASIIYFIKHFNLVVILLKNRYFWWITSLFIVFFLYAWIYPVYDNYSPGHLISLYLSVIIICLFSISIMDDNFVEKIKKISITSSMITCIYILFSEFSSIVIGGTRIGESGSGNVNTIAIYLGFLSIPILYSVLIGKCKKDLPVLLITIFFTLLTGSKKGIVIILSSTLIMALYKNKMNIFKYLKYTLFIGVILFLIFKVDYFYNIIGFRIYDFLGNFGLVSDSAYSNSTDLRREMYRIAPLLISRNPIFGSGWGYFTEYSGLLYYSHSNYIELLVTFGIAGTLYYYSIFITTIKKLFKKHKLNNETLMFIIMLFVILINDFSAVSFTSILLNYVFVFWGLIYVLNISGGHDEKDFKNI